MGVRCVSLSIICFVWFHVLLCISQRMETKESEEKAADIEVESNVVSPALDPDAGNSA
jgi:hypothetical protein